LQEIKNDLEMVLSTVQSKNKQLEEDLEREQQWYEEQKQILEILNKMEEEANTEAEHPSTKRELNELTNKVLKLKTYKEELLIALGEFLDEHFPSPEEGENIIKKIKSSCFVNFLNLILLVFQMLINTLLTTPHEPYITINESFWPPYIELLLRFGMALRDPEDPNRMRLQAYNK
ncbi:CENPK protein, partial [Calcarius ornatus]|nr:CENPK protein [Calcarius ornatus]